MKSVKSNFYKVLLHCTILLCIGSVFPGDVDGSIFGDIFRSTHKQQQGQCTPIVNRISSLIVRASNEQNPPLDIATYYVKYDTTNNGSISSTAYHDLLNRSGPRRNAPSWSRWNCPELNGREHNCALALGPGSAFSRGHLTPKCPFKFSLAAFQSTYRCTNQVPQIQVGFNDRSWAHAEECAAKIADEESGFVMTGVCESELVNQPIPPPAQFTPSCFWKLVCYSYQGITFVAGFHGLNVNDALNPIANNILSQREVIGMINSQFYDVVIYDTWTDARAPLLANRSTANQAPTAQACRAALDLPDAERARLKELNACRVRSVFDDRQCEDECYCDNEP